MFQGPRAQADRDLYKQFIQQELSDTDNLEIRAGGVDDIVLDRSIAHTRQRLMAPPDTVVIVGASVAGMFAASAVAPNVGRVIVLDADEEPNDHELEQETGFPKPRNRTMQAKLLHVLLQGGLDAIERLLPGFHEELAKHGAVPTPVIDNAYWNLAGNWFLPKQVKMTATSHFSSQLRL